MRSSPVAALLLLTACGGATEAPATPTADGPAVTPLFCAYGGVGIVPVPTPPDLETVFAVFVFSVENPGPPLTVSITGGALVDETGAPLASLRRVDHFVVLDRVEPVSPATGSFAVHLSPEGRPFDGTLPTGTTILRARFSLDHPVEAFPTHCRLELGGDASLEVVSTLDGSWPTS